MTMEILELISFKPCESLGTNFVDVYFEDTPIARQVGKRAGEQWLEALKVEDMQAQLVFIKVMHIAADPLLAAGTEINSFMPDRINQISESKTI